MGLGHKSQSALEYMMTYGWAILIIVVIAVALYSMGIFNPSSNVTVTVTGFSDLGSVAAQCTANGILRISLGDSTGYEVKYVKKEEHEDFQPRNEKLPVNIDKEQLKITKNGEKIKVRKRDKLAIIEAIKQDNIDRVDEILKALKS